MALIMFQRQSAGSRSPSPCIRPWPWILVGLASLILYPELGPDEKKLGFVYAMRDYLPTGMRGMLVAAFFAAYMSTIATQLNWGTSYLVNDFYRRFVRRGGEERHYVLASRLMTLLVMVASFLVTLTMDTISGAWAFIIEAGAGLGLVLILRWFWWRINAWSEIAAMVTPFVIFGYVRLFTDLGGALIDTAPTYGTSEVVLGELIREIGNADKIFMATKISRAQGREAGLAQVAQSEERLAPCRISLNQVHNLGDWQTQLALLRELQQEGRVKYIGITTSRDSQYEDLAEILKTEEMDFVQFDYAIDNRNAEEALLPIAMDQGIATLINGPFGRTRLFRRVGDQPVPEWAQEFGATSWAQFFLKWLLGHPGVTVPIPATSDPGHLRDNMGAGLGRVPDEAERRRMAEFIDGLPQV